MMDKETPSQGPSMPPPNHVTVGFRAVGGVYKGVKLDQSDKFHYPNRNSSFAPKLKKDRKEIGRSVYMPFHLEPIYQKLAETVAQDPMMQSGGPELSPGSQTRGASYPHTIQTYDTKPAASLKR